MHHETEPKLASMVDSGIDQAMMQGVGFEAGYNNSYM